jgi:hypothetical protein
MTKGKRQEIDINKGWNEALEDAEKKYAQGREYVSRMRAIIRGIKRKIEAGEDFPGEKRDAK